MASVRESSRDLGQRTVPLDEFRRHALGTAAVEIGADVVNQATQKRPWVTQPPDLEPPVHAKPPVLENEPDADLERVAGESGGLVMKLASPNDHAASSPDAVLGRNADGEGRSQVSVTGSAA